MLIFALPYKEKLVFLFYVAGLLKKCESFLVLSSISENSNQLSKMSGLGFLVYILKLNLRQNFWHFYFRLAHSEFQLVISLSKSPQNGVEKQLWIPLYHFSYIHAINYDLHPLQSSWVCDGHFSSDCERYFKKDTYCNVTLIATWYYENELKDIHFSLGVYWLQS